MTYPRVLAALAAVTSITLTAGAWSGARQDPPAQPPQQTSEVRLAAITGPPGLPPKFAVPDFIALSNDPEVVAAAKVMGQVLWDDLTFEKEFYMIARDTYRTIPAARSIDDVPVDRWRELGADGLVVGSVEKSGNGALVRMRLINVASGQSAIAKEYSGPFTNPRLYSHTISDDIHLQQRGLRGVARTQVAYTSDRAGDRMKGGVGERFISNIYFSDYDGFNEKRVSVVPTLEISPAFSPDKASIAYVSYRSGFPDIIVQSLTGRSQTMPARGSETRHNQLPVWSPDGARLAFSSTRDGNSEIYVVNRDGSGLRRVTNHPSIDTTPTWSPTGQQLAFTSERSGNPNIWIVNADGTQPRQLTRETHADRATWSPAPLNEIAFTSQRGGGHDIKIYDFANGAFRVLTTDGIGSNEQPSFSPTGRHVAFSSNRAGKLQIFTIARDGSGLRQITRTGNNKYPSWSNTPVPAR